MLEENNLKIKYGYKYYLILIGFLITTLTLPFLAVYFIQTVFYKFLSILCSIIFLFQIIRLIRISIKYIVFADSNITIHTYFLKIEVEHEDFIYLHKSYIKTTKMTFFIEHILEKEIIFDKLIRFLNIRNTDEALEGIKDGVVLYLSEEKMKINEQKVDQSNRNSMMFIITIQIAICVIVVGSYIYGMFMAHQNLEYVLGGISFWVFLLILAIKSDFIEKRIKNKNVQAIVSVILSLLLCILFTYSITKLALLFGVDLSRYKI